MPLEASSLAEWEAGGLKGLLSVVIPAHNEEGRIEGMLAQWRLRSLSDHLVDVCALAAQDGEHFGRDVDAGDADAAFGQGDGDAPGADADFQ